MTEINLFGENSRWNDIRGVLTVNVQHHPFADWWWYSVTRDAQVGAHLASGYFRQSQRFPLGGSYCNTEARRWEFKILKNLTDLKNLSRGSNANLLIGIPYVVTSNSHPMHVSITNESRAISFFLSDFSSLFFENKFVQIRENERFTLLRDIDHFWQQYRC